MFLVYLFFRGVLFFGISYLEYIKGVDFSNFIVVLKV